ncbi:hypothetical protein DsansV1_C08g0078291 [Dioscorea sansibarensis]
MPMDPCRYHVYIGVALIHWVHRPASVFWIQAVSMGHSFSLVIVAGTQKFVDKFWGWLSDN